MDALVGVLGRERILLERLVYRLTGLRDLLAAGEVRFVGWAAHDVDQAIAAVRRTELHRAVVLAGIAERMVPGADSLPLAALAECAGEPWRCVLVEHRGALVSLTGEVDALTAQVRALADRGEYAPAAAAPAGCPQSGSPFLPVSLPRRNPVASR